MYNRSSSQQHATSTPRRRAQSRLLELERHIAINECIPMTISPGAKKPISAHIVRFSQAIGRLFVLDFNDLTMSKFVEHQMLTTFKEFRADCHRHFKKYSVPRRLVPTHQTHWFDVIRIGTSSTTTISVVHSRKYELAERKWEPVNRVELFWETHVRAGTFMSQATEDAYPTPEGSQPLSEDEICDQVLGRRPTYSKGLGWGPKPKARKTASASSSSTSCLQSIEKEIKLQAKLHEALERIEVQDRNHQALASQVESMKKMIEEITRAQQGPPHDP
ncbi:CACTA en-spm transposon protein [Cucumis melo var. makuwa]|uniref:CACTA en-spm transposon protein n=1 Tax=Cucumis melo var. makuwa TaxID=1194695 RepID=A0A5D3BSG3_CUCMM|nr:CACTA en-spm transposon protein [Cucumis melo var. makuwa]TYK01166.1 CACTA en-spm transposon protein [Cucumis melo var. makuwa]